MKFYTTDISPLATVEEAFITLESRLNSLFAGDQFGLRLRQNSYRFNGVSLRNTVTDSSMQADIQLVISKVEHFAKPTSVPSRSPSSQPSRQPTAQPTSMPSFMKQTKWLDRLREEMTERFAKQDRENRALYFQLDLGNITFFSTNHQFESFMLEIIKRMVLNKKLKTVTLITGNDSSSALKVYQCGEEVALKSLQAAFQLRTRETTSVLCDGEMWRVQYCAANDSVPHLCIGCSNPCTQPCFKDPSWDVSTVLSPTHYNCSFFYGGLKVLYIEVSPHEFPARLFGYSIGGFWIAMMLSVIVAIIYHSYLTRFRIPLEFEINHNNDFEAMDPENLFCTGSRGTGSQWSVHNIHMPKHMRSTTIHEGNNMKLNLIRSLNENIFGSFYLYHSKISRLIHSLVFNHRIVKVYSHFFEEGWNLFWFTSSLAGYGLLLATMLAAQYPFDRGQCADLVDENSCESIQSNFISSRQICRWYNTFTSAQEELLGDLLDYQTNCLLETKEVPSLDVFRLAILGVLFVCFSRLTMLEPFLKRFVVPRLDRIKLNQVQTEDRDAGKMFIRPSTTDTFAGSAHFASAQTNSVVSTTMSSRFSAKSNSVLPNPQHMKDFILEISFAPAGEQGMEENYDPQMRVNVVSRKEIEDGMNALCDDHVFDIHQENYSKLEIELRAPEVTTEVTSAKSNFLASLTSCCNMNNEDNTGVAHSELQIVHRAQQVHTDIEFKQFYSHLLAHRGNIIDLVYQKKFDYFWALRNSHFSADHVMFRPFSWQIRHNFQVHQAAGDYFHEYINSVNSIASIERIEAVKNPENLQLRILYLFVLDMLGHFSPENSLLRRRLYRQLNPQNAITCGTKVISILFLLTINLILLYFTWETVRYFPKHHMQNWYQCLLVAVVLDFLFLENVDNAWCFFVLPATCLETFHNVKVEIVQLILLSNFAPPMMPWLDPRRAEMGGGSSVLSSSTTHKGTGLLRQNTGLGVPSASSVLSMASRSVKPASASMITFPQRPFETPDYFFVSRKFARLFPSLPESQLTLQYHADLPRRALSAKWCKNSDIRISLLDPLYYVWTWIMGHKSVDDDDSIDSCERKHRHKSHQRDLENNRLRLRDQLSAVSHSVSMYHSFSIGLRSTIVYLGSFSTRIQRLMILFIFVGILLILRLFIPRVLFDTFWYVSYGILGATVMIVVVLFLYYHSFAVHDFLDEAQFVSWLSYCGMQSTEYPPIDGHETDDVPSEVFESDQSDEDMDGSDDGGSAVSSLSSENEGHQRRRELPAQGPDIIYPFYEEDIEPMVPYALPSKDLDHHNGFGSESKPSTAQLAQLDADVNIQVLSPVATQFSQTMYVQSSSPTEIVDALTVPLPSSVSPSKQIDRAEVGVVKRTIPVVGFQEPPQFMFRQDYSDSSESSYEEDEGLDLNFDDNRSQYTKGKASPMASNVKVQPRALIMPKGRKLQPKAVERLLVGTVSSSKKINNKSSKISIFKSKNSQKKGNKPSISNSRIKAKEEMKSGGRKPAVPKLTKSSKNKPKNVGSKRDEIDSVFDESEYDYNDYDDEYEDDSDY